ncbi:MAG TPA: DUF2868 domain-containing protein [Campylobacterales bacterium]|nr:DUF2868 domain-containing protein [Campylobacterales bacterium]HIP41448.1 DUF2868 domain-containing protein [Campylobacterales bacterium]
MQTKNTQLSIKSYLDLSQLLEEYKGNHEENRTFALQHEAFKNDPLTLLYLWLNKNRFRVTSHLKSETFLTHFLTISTVLAFIFLLVGFLTGIGLLSYSGHEPVNIIYYLLVAMVLPVVSLLLSTLSMISDGLLSRFFNLFFPLHWIEKFVEFLPFDNKIELSEIKLSSSLTKWMFLHRIQLFSLLFSFGLLMALILMVMAKDIAFGWSTTLQISDESFQTLLASIGFTWQSLMPNAIPSLELVEISHYFRLGERLDNEMIHNANKLGAWWQFLAMTTLVYAIFLRFIVWIFSRYGYQRQLNRDFLALKGAQRLIKEFTTPYVSTKSPKIEKHLEIIPETEEQITETPHQGYPHIIGWNYSSSEMQLANDSKSIEGLSVETVGGRHSFREDEQIANSIDGTVLLYVKSWEPPTMDFVDFLEMLIDNDEIDEIQLYPLGTVGRYYESDAKDIAVWKRKIQALKVERVWVVDDAEQ